MGKLIIILSLLFVSCEDYGTEPGCEDACGVCNGDNSTCSGCIDIYAENYDEEAIVNDENSCTFTYASISIIFEDHCFSCHSAAQEIQGGLDLSSYNLGEGWQGSGEQTTLVPTDASSSYLYELINDDLMPQSPASPLSADKKNAIRDWINQGANE